MSTNCSLLKCIYRLRFWSFPLYKLLTSHLLLFCHTSTTYHSLFVYTCSVISGLDNGCLKATNRCPKRKNRTSIPLGIPSLTFDRISKLRSAETMTSGLLRPNGFNRSQRILADQDAGEEMEEARSRTLTCGNHDVTRSVSPRESGLPQVEHQYSNNNIVCWTHRVLLKPGHISQDRQRQNYL